MNFQLAQSLEIVSLGSSDVQTERVIVDPTVGSVLFSPKKYFVVGQVLGNLEAIHNDSFTEHFRDSLNALKSNLNEFTDLKLLIESLETQFEFSLENGDMRSYQNSVSFLIKEIRKRLGIEIKL